MQIAANASTFDTANTAASASAPVVTKSERVPATLKTSETQLQQSSRSLRLLNDSNPANHPGLRQYQQNAALNSGLGNTIALLGVDTYA